MFSSKSADLAKPSMVSDLRSRLSRRRPRWWRMRCAPMSRLASKPSGRDVQCLKATFRLTRKASATRSTGTPANCLREARAGRKGPTSSLELPHASIGSTGLADGRCWWSVGCATELSSDKARGAHGPDARLKEMLAALSKQRIHTSRNLLTATADALKKRQQDESGRKHVLSS